MENVVQPGIAAILTLSPFPDTMYAMDRIVLITNVDTPLGFALTKLYINDGDKVIGTVSSKNPESSLKEMDKGVIDIVEWHRSSAIESKNLILSIVRKYKKLDEVLILQSIGAASIPLHETGIADMEKDLDTYLKSLFFLTREIINTYITRNSGMLYFIYTTNLKQVPSPVSEALKSGISGFIGQVLQSYKDEHFKVHCIESSHTNMDLLSSYIYKTINERLRQCGSKRIQFHQRGSLFSGFKK